MGAEPPEPSGQSEQSEQSERSELPDDVSRKLRPWSWAVRVFLLVLVFWTCWPVLDKPQLEADDFRYLALVQQLQVNPDADLFGSMVVENRWDHMWWVGIEGKARFFRPTWVCGEKSNSQVAHGAGGVYLYRQPGGC